LKDSYLESGFILDKKFGVGQSKQIKNAKILLANTPMDTDKVLGSFSIPIPYSDFLLFQIKIYGARVRVDSMDKVAEIEKAEKSKMKAKVDKILKHSCK
jgi:T-complex protein 1 subunit beta